MCRLCFNKLYLSIKVIDIEKQLGGVSYTLRTVQHLQEAYHDCTFSLIVGSDVKAEFSSWYNFNKLREVVSIIEVPRGDLSPIPDVNSSDIRSKIKNGIAFADLVESEVAVYIITNGLYR